MNVWNGWIVASVVVVFAIVFYVLRSRSEESSTDSASAPQAGPGATISTPGTQLPPEHAIPFGYKSQWLAVRTENPVAALVALGADGAQPAGWSDGVGASGGTVFATPPLDGWVLLVGSFPEILGDTDEGAVTLVSRLSADLQTEVQYFGTHRVVEYHAWVRANNGDIVRAYAYLGERGETLLQAGAKTPEERELGFNFFDEEAPDAKDDAYWERKDLSFPDEGNVMVLAGRWSINPAELGERGLVGTGWIANWHP